jgi:uncharacterized protein
MIQIATIETDKAERLMKALCNHFARKRTAHYEGDKGYIDFGDAKCEITASSNTMIFQAEADTTEGLDHVKRAVGNHWKDPTYIQENGIWSILHARF